MATENLEMTGDAGRNGELEVRECSTILWIWNVYPVNILGSGSLKAKSPQKPLSNRDKRQQYLFQMRDEDCP